MEIKGKVHIFFEQSATFRDEFRKLGYEAYCYDIQNNFGKTDYQIDLFAEIENAYGGGKSIFDQINQNDFVMAFFPCIYFCAASQMQMSFGERNYRYLTPKQKADTILKRVENREKYFALAIKLFAVVETLKLRMVMENPWSEQTYLKANFIYAPTMVDKDRSLRGDYFKKPTAYWFVNCEPTFGKSIQKNNDTKRLEWVPKSKEAGLCSEERSMISPDYARNFICDFIIGKAQKHSQLSLFD
jgi:hypothetical protein